MKKLFFILLAFVVIDIPQAFAQGFVPLAPINGLTDPETVKNSGNLAIFFNNLYKYLIGVAAALAVIEIIWGGLEIATQDSITKNKDGKERIRNAILGLVLVLSPVLVFSIINPNILNLSLSLKEIKTAPNTSGPNNPPPPPNCLPGQPTANCNIFEEGWYARPANGGYCFEVKTSPDGKNFFCARNDAGCKSSYNQACSKPEDCKSTCTLYQS